MRTSYIQVSVFKYVFWITFLLMYTLPKVYCNTRRMFVDLTDGTSKARQISNPSVIIRVTANNQISVGAQIYDAVLPSGSYCAFYEGTTAAQNLIINYTQSIDNAKYITFPNKRVYAVCEGPLPIFAKFNFIPFSHDCSGSHLNNSIHFYNLMYSANFFNTSSAPTGVNLVCEIEVDSFDGYFIFSDNSESPDTIQIEDSSGNVFDSLVGTEGNNYYRVNRTQPFTVQIVSDASNHNIYSQSLFAVTHDCFVNETEPFIFYSPENCSILAVKFHHAGGPWSARLYNTYLNESQGECWLHDGNHADHGDVMGQFYGDIITSGYVSTTGEYMFLKCVAVNDSLPVVGVYAVYVTVEDCGSYDVTSDEIEISGSYDNMTLCQWTAYPEYPYNGIHVEIDDLDRDDNLIIVGDNITNAATFSADPEFDDMDSSFDVAGHVVYIQYYSPGDTEFEITISVKRKSEIRCEHHAAITVIHDDANLMTSFMGEEMVVSDSYVLRMSEVPIHCRPTVQNHRYVSFKFNLSSCGVDISETIDDYIYNYTVRVLPKLKPNLPIYRHIDETLTFTCLFKKDALAQVNAMETMPTLFPYLMNSALGLIEVSFQLYSDSDFETRLHSGNSRIEATDYIYVDITMKEFEGMTMKTARCWATPTYNETVDTPEYNIIIDECPADNDEDGASGIQVLVNDEPASFQFQFCSFQWFNVSEEDQKIYLHCEVNFCDDDGNMCEPKSCSPNRNARDVHDDYMRTRELMKETHIITQGPIYVKSKKDYPCRGSVCSDICTLNLDDQPVCSCLNGRTLLDDGVSCVAFEDVEFLLNSTNFENSILVALVLSALVLFGALIARCYS